MELVTPGLGLVLITIFLILLSLVSLALVIYCIVKVAQSDKNDLEKVLWILIVLTFPFLGSIAFLVAGRDR